MPHRVFRIDPPADLEMDLRGIHGAGRSRLSDHLTAFNLVAFADQQTPIVGVGRDITVGMAQQHELAITGELGACIDHLTGGRRADLCPGADLDIDRLMRSRSSKRTYINRSHSPSKTA